MNIEIYEELVALSDRCEQSILANKNINREPENEPASSSEPEKENDTEDNILTYTDRRKRRGRGGRYFDILAALKQWLEYMTCVSLSCYARLIDDVIMFSAEVYRILKTIWISSCTEPRFYFHEKGHKTSISNS